MKTIGFLISHKNGEGRRALLPEHIGKIKNADKLYFETGYGDSGRRERRRVRGLRLPYCYARAGSCMRYHHRR